MNERKKARPVFIARHTKGSTIGIEVVVDARGVVRGGSATDILYVHLHRSACIATPLPPQDLPRSAVVLVGMSDQVSQSPRRHVVSVLEVAGAGLVVAVRLGEIHHLNASRSESRRIEGGRTGVAYLLHFLL